MAEGANRDDKRLECPVCLDFFEKPIRQCVIGHSFCGKCLDPMNIKICPECRSQVTETRNYKLEELLDTIPLPCMNKKAGCPYLLDREEMIIHVLECKHRILKCEGKKFCDWTCNWEGQDILQHYKDKHIKNAVMEYNTNVTVPFNDTNKFTDLHIISAHYQLFWYKHKIDIENKMAYWAIQIIGPRKIATYFYYEFEIYNEEDQIKKFKITEYCTSDVEDIDTIFSSGKCVAISLKMLKNYTNKKDMYSFRFRLMKIPNPDKSKSRSQSACRTPNKNKSMPVPPLQQQRGQNVPPQGGQNLQQQPRFPNMQPRFDMNGPVWLPFVAPLVPKPVNNRRRK